MRHIPIYPACRADACSSGDKPCPTPEACCLPEPTRAEVADAIFFPVLGVALACFAALVYWAC